MDPPPHVGGYDLGVSMSKGKILVIRGGAIGDFILTLPAIAALRSQFPQVHLEILGYPHIAQLALAGGLVDRVQPIEARGLAGFFARDGQLDPDLMDYFSEFDLIVSYLYDPDEIFRTNVGRCSPAQFIAAPHRPDESEKLHATKVYLKPLERLAIFDADEVPRLSINSQPSTINFLALHPGSGSEKKNWPEENWAEFIARFANSIKVKLLLVGGEAEGDRLKRLSANLPRERCEVAQSLPLAELAARLQSCAAFVGHDSGISHLAAALGLPCLILWADTIEEIWRPQGERVVVLKNADGLAAMSVEQVSRELVRVLAATHP
jgi:heptosyltransferase III